MMTTLGTRRAVATMLVGLFLLCLGGTAFAYWTATGNAGEGAAAAGEMPDGQQPFGSIAASNDHDVLLSWMKSTLSNGGAVPAYEVTRYDAEDTELEDGDDACDGLVEPGDPTATPVTCLDEDVPTGDWVYTVTPVLNNWVGDESEASAAIEVGAATLILDEPNPFITNPPETLDGDLDGFFDSETVDFALDSAGVDELEGTIEGSPAPSAVNTTGDAEVEIDIPSDIGEGAQQIYAVGDGPIGDEEVDGNVATAGIFVDTIAPEAPTLTSNPTDPTTSTTASFEFEDESENVTFECALDGSDFEECTSPTSYEDLELGEHTFEVKAIDGAGNESDVTSFTWTITSATPPDVAITFPVHGATYTTATYVAGCPTGSMFADLCGTATDNGSSGLDNVQVSIQQGTGNYWDADGGFDSSTEVLLDADGTSAWSRNFAASNFSTDGQYTVRAVVTDNTSATGTASSTFTIDQNAPQVASIDRADPSPTNLQSVDYTVTFTESVNGVDSGDFSLVSGGGITGASITSVTGSGSTRNVEVNTGSGDGTIRLDLSDNDSITDGAGNTLAGPLNANGSFTGQTYEIEKSSPVVSSINRASATPTNASSVDFTVTFSKPVTGVDSTDFTVPMTGAVSGASVTGVSGTGATRTVSVNTGSGNTGTVGLNLVDDDSITDNGGNKLGGTGNGNGNFTGQTYTIDKIAPTVSSINRGTPSGATTGAASVDFAVTFSESVTGVDSTDFNVTMTGGNLTGASVTSVSGSGATRTVTVNTGTGQGTLGLDLVDDDSIVDAATNELGGAGNGNGNRTGDQTYTIDRDPFVVSINRLDTTPTNAATVRWEVKFSENVTGVTVSGGTADFALTQTGTVNVNANALTLSGSEDTYTVTSPTNVSSATPPSTINGTLRLDVIDNDSIDDTDAPANDLGGTGTTGAANGSFNAGQSYTIDKIAFGVPSTRDSSGTNDGLIESGDEIRISFAEDMSVSTFCSVWSGNNSNQTLTDGVATFGNNNSSSPNNRDTLTVSSASCTGAPTFRFGTLNLVSNAYVNTTTVFSSSTINWDAANDRLTIILGTCTSGCSVVNPATVSTAVTMNWQPLSSITDILGNSVTGASSANVTQF